MPYSATVIINGMEYGKGYGSSKKQAKSEAGNEIKTLINIFIINYIFNTILKARASLEILIPDLKEMTEGGNRKLDPSLQDLSVCSHTFFLFHKNFRFESLELLEYFYL